MTAQELGRDRILTHGLGIASAHGLHALSMGDVARQLDLPRSGLFAHFATKESLQLAVLDQAADMFVRDVIEPGMAAAAGEVRVGALFGKWMQWSRSPRLKGGCPFVQASAESDALPEPVRVKLKEVLDHWSGVLAEAVREAKESAKFRGDLDESQVVFELYGLYLSHHFWHWSMKDRSAGERTMKAFARLIDASR